MGEIVVTEGKQPSQFLSQLIKQAVDNFVDFTTNWIEILERGKYEGFTKAELKEIMIPMMKDQFRAMGLDENQIKNRLYYQFNAKEEKERQKENYQRKKLYIQSNDYNNDIEQSSISDRIKELEEENEGLKEELERLQTDLKDANETIRSMCFEENPEIFRINKADPNSMIFTRMKASDAIDIVKNDLKKDNFYDIAWKQAI